MRKAIIIGLSFGVILMLFGADIGERFQVYYWNNYYWAKARMPDGSMAEIKDPNDLTYSQWKAKFIKHWKDSQEPPDLPILYETDDYAIRDPNDGNLMLQWKIDDVRLTVTKTSLPALADSVKKMNEIFTKMP